MSLPSMLGYIDLVRVNLLRDINPSPLILHEEVPSAFRTIVPDSYGIDLLDNLMPFLIF